MAKEQEAREESLVPMIEREERHLAEMLEATRAQAERRVQEAERKARERIAQARERLPSVMVARKQRATAQFEKEADGLRKEASVSAQDLERTAALARPKAVSRIVEVVWPGRPTDQTKEARKRVARG